MTLTYLRNFFFAALIAAGALSVGHIEEDYTLAVVVLISAAGMCWAQWREPPMYLPTWLVTLFSCTVGLGMMLWILDGSRGYGFSLYQICWPPILILSVLLLSKRSKRDYAWMGLVSLLMMIVCARQFPGPTFIVLFLIFAIIGIWVLYLIAMDNRTAGRVFPELPPGKERSDKLTVTELSATLVTGAMFSILFALVGLLGAFVLFFIVPRPTNGAKLISPDSKLVGG